MAFTVTCDLCGRTVSAPHAVDYQRCNANGMAVYLDVARTPGWRYQIPLGPGFTAVHVCPRCVFDERNAKRIADAVREVFEPEEEV